MTKFGCLAMIICCLGVNNEARASVSRPASNAIVKQEQSGNQSGVVTKTRVVNGVDAVMEFIRRDEEKRTLERRGEIENGVEALQNGVMLGMQQGINQGVKQLMERMGMFLVEAEKIGRPLNLGRVGKLMGMREEEVPLLEQALKQYAAKAIEEGRAMLLTEGMGQKDLSSRSEFKAKTADANSSIGRAQQKLGKDFVPAKPGDQRQAEFDATMSIENIVSLFRTIAAFDSAGREYSMFTSWAGAHRAIAEASVKKVIDVVESPGKQEDWRRKVIIDEFDKIVGNGNSKSCLERFLKAQEAIRRGQRGVTEDQIRREQDLIAGLAEKPQLSWRKELLKILEQSICGRTDALKTQAGSAAEDLLDDRRCEIMNKWDRANKRARSSYWNRIKLQIKIAETFAQPDSGNTNLKDRLYEYELELGRLRSKSDADLKNFEYLDDYLDKFLDLWDATEAQDDARIQACNAELDDAKYTTAFDYFEEVDSKEREGGLAKLEALKSELEGKLAGTKSLGVGETIAKLKVALEETKGKIDSLKSGVDHSILKSTFFMRRMLELHDDFVAETKKDMDTKNEQLKKCVDELDFISQHMQFRFLNRDDIDEETLMRIVGATGSKANVENILHSIFRVLSLINGINPQERPEVTKSKDRAAVIRVQDSGFALADLGVLGAQIRKSSSRYVIEGELQAAELFAHTIAFVEEHVGLKRFSLDEAIEVFARSRGDLVETANIGVFTAFGTIMAAMIMLDSREGKPPLQDIEQKKIEEAMKLLSFETTIRDDQRRLPVPTSSLGTDILSKAISQARTKGHNVNPDVESNHKSILQNYSQSNIGGLTGLLKAPGEF